MLLIFSTMWAEMLPWLTQQIKTKGLIIAFLFIAVVHLVTRDNSNNAYIVSENRALKLENSALNKLYKSELRNELVENQKLIIANQGIEIQKLTLIEEYMRMQTYKNQNP